MRKAALITGASRRLGAFLALELARLEWDIAIHFHSGRKQAHDLVKKIRALGRKAEAFGADLSDAGAAQALVEEAFSQIPFGLLVHNASPYPEDNWQEVAAQALEHQEQVIAWSPLIMNRTYGRLCPEGQIVHLLDARIGDYDRKHFSYHIAKRTLGDLTRLLAWEMAPHFRVNAIAPGLILKPDELPKESWEKWAASAPLKRTGQPQDLLKALLFLVENDYITGQTIFVDGGRHLRGEFHGV